MADEWITPQEAGKRMVDAYKDRAGRLSPHPIDILPAIPDSGICGWVILRNIHGVAVTRRRIYAGNEHPLAQAGMCVWYERRKVKNG